MTSLPARRDGPLLGAPRSSLSRTQWTLTLQTWEAAVEQALGELENACLASSLLFSLSPQARIAHFGERLAGNRQEQLAGIPKAMGVLIQQQELCALRVLSAAFSSCFSPESPLGPQPCWLRWAPALAWSKLESIEAFRATAQLLVQTQARGFRGSADFQHPFFEEPWFLALSAPHADVRKDSDLLLHRLATLIAAQVPFPAETPERRYYGGCALWRGKEGVQEWTRAPETIARFEVQALALAERWAVQDALSAHASNASTPLPRDHQPPARRHRSRL